jgi:hypothetical protein
MYVIYYSTIVDYYYLKGTHDPRVGHYPDLGQVSL